MIEDLGPQLVGKIIVITGMRDPFVTMRLQVVAQHGDEIEGLPVDRNNIRKLEKKVSIKMEEYYLKEISDAL
jgi:hypothetical protein